MVVDVSWLGEGMPFFAFILVFVVVYAILVKTKLLGGEKTINAIVSLVLAIIFISFTNVRTYITNVSLWFTVILILAFFFILGIMFILKDPAAFMRPIALTFTILLILIALIAIFYTLPAARGFLPGTSESVSNPFLLSIKNFVLGAKFLSGLFLVVLAVVVGFIIAK